MKDCPEVKKKKLYNRGDMKNKTQKKKPTSTFTIIVLKSTKVTLRKVTRVEVAPYLKLKYNKLL